MGRAGRRKKLPPCSWISPRGWNATAKRLGITSRFTPGRWAAARRGFTTKTNYLARPRSRRWFFLRRFFPPRAACSMSGCGCRLRIRTTPRASHFSRRRPAKKNGSRGPNIFSACWRNPAAASARTPAGVIRSTGCGAAASSARIRRSSRPRRMCSRRFCRCNNCRRVPSGKRCWSPSSATRRRTSKIFRIPAAA